MSLDQERRPVRLDSDATKIEDQEEFASVNEHGYPEEKYRGISFTQSRPSIQDHPYNPAPRRQSRIPNLKGSSPIPGAQSEYQEQFGNVPWRCSDPHRYNIPKKDDSWKKCHSIVEKYDNEMCDAWKDEVDKLLIFAGLFSATITAFTIESYKWLSEDNDDVSLRLLAFMAQQASNATVSVPSDLLPSPFSVTSSDVRINAVWFLSLTLALTTVLIGILCLQWLREYQRDASLPHKDAVALRQMRYEGLLYWRVPDILTALPILLQTSLILFFVGLLDLLWARNIAVAACVTGAVGVVMLFVGITTALPAMQHAFSKDKHLRVPQCPYKSPQSWLFYLTGHTLFWIFSSFNLPWAELDAPRFHRLLKSAGDLNWMSFDMRWRQFRDAQEVVRGTARVLKDSADLIHGLQWINSTFSQNVDAVYPIYHSLADMDVITAATTISGFYLDGLLDNATMRVMLDDRFSPTVPQKRDIVSAYYLHVHQDTHPILKTAYVESVIRILNSQDVPQPFYDWLSEILQDLASTSPSSASPSSLALLEPEITVQILLCVKSLLPRKYGLQIHDIVVAWALLHRLISPALSAASQDDRGGVAAMVVNLDHLKLACSMFEEFEQWMTRGKEIGRLDRVKLCAEGMLTLFPPSVNLQWLEGVCPDMMKARSLVHSLEDQVETLGGPSAVLLREQWWLDYWEVYSEKDWRWLLNNFNKISQE
ncbi:hypothetical protein JR316_0011847 [Psilocybe cubensis]|uniref:DUF6535 domain-containing protein n=2 Tax=Psilocybe cubensis TaxID=181762 RepID=A0A8H7XNI1_PSICU|nr:hypothetical protein JR316_0011847 [Psilocybe cubensis]KAH9476274.1 hypothetical protein JR316_0011847 [Psilocybe cubensis]